MIRPEFDVITFAIACLFIASGCGNGEASLPAHTHRAATLLIGPSDSTSHEVFHNIRGVLRGPAGQIVVANSGSNQIRVFSIDGSLLRESGGSGAGPGEFQSLQALVGGFHSDSIIAWDPLTRRVSIWSDLGEYGRALNVRYGFAPQLEGLIRDSLLVFSNETGRRAPTSRPWFTWEDSLRVAIYGTEGGEALRPVAVVPNITRVLAQAPSGRLIGAPAPASVGALIEVTTDRIYVGLPNDALVVILNGNGAIKDTIKLRIPARPRTSDHVEAWIEEHLRDVPRMQRGGIRRYLSQYPQPPVFPYFDGMYVDETGDLWIRRYVVPGDAESRLVRIDSLGHPSAEVILPVRFRPFQIGGDGALGVQLNDYGEESVALYSIRPETIESTR